MQYRVVWTEKNSDGRLSEESITMKAKDGDDAIKQANAVGNVVEIKKVERL